MRKIEINGKEITMREPKVRDMKAIAHIENAVEKEQTFIANLTGMTVSELDELALKEYTLLQNELKSFLS